MQRRPGNESPQEVKEVKTINEEDKEPYSSPIKITENMNDDQKKFFGKYNRFRELLLKHELMKSK